MMNDRQWNDLMVEHELAYLRGIPGYAWSFFNRSL